MIAHYTRFLVNALLRDGRAEVDYYHLTPGAARSRLYNAARRAGVRITTTDVQTGIPRPDGRPRGVMVAYVIDKASSTLRETFCIYCQREFTSSGRWRRHVLTKHPGTYAALSITKADPDTNIDNEARID